MALSQDEQAVKLVVQLCSGRIGRTQLMKLLYLSDLESHRYTSRPITSFQWSWYDYGPFSARVYSVKDQLVSRGLVVETADEEGGGYVLFDSEPAEITLIPVQRQLIQSVCARFGHLAPWKIKEYVYRETEPMVAAQQRNEWGGRLSMDLVNGQGSEDLGGMELSEIMEGMAAAERGLTPLADVLPELHHQHTD